MASHCIVSVSTGLRIRSLRPFWLNHEGAHTYARRGTGDLLIDRSRPTGERDRVGDRARRGGGDRDRLMDLR